MIGNQEFPQIFFIAVFVERLGAFLRHNNILIDVLTTPAPCVFCLGQAVRRAFGKGNAPGLPLQNSKAPAVPSRKLSGLWLRKNPQALVLHVATPLSFLSLAVMSFAELIWRIFGETPGKKERKQNHGTHYRPNPVQIDTLQQFQYSKTL